MMATLTPELSQPNCGAGRAMCTCLPLVTATAVNTASCQDPGQLMVGLGEGAGKHHGIQSSEDWTDGDYTLMAACYGLSAPC